MESKYNTLLHLQTLSLSSLTKYQRGLIKGHLVDMDNHFNEIFSSFDPLNPEFSLDNRIIDIFSNYFSFHLFSKYKDQYFKLHIQQLNNLAIELLNSPSNTLIVIDTSVRNNIATSITYIHIQNKPIIKTLYHTINVTSTEAELFAIKCGIN